MLQKKLLVLFGDLFGVENQQDASVTHKNLAIITVFAMFSVVTSYNKHFVARVASAIRFS